MMNIDISRFAPARRGLVLAGVFAGILLSAPQAWAGLAINLVFPNGSTSMNLTATNTQQDIPVLVYGTVTGVNPVTQTVGATTGNFDGLDYAYYDIISSVGSGGALMGGIDSGASNAAHAPTLEGLFGAVGSQSGTVQDLNGDGIADLGSESVLSQIPKPRANFDTYNNYGGTAPYVIVGGANDNSVSFLLETIYFQTGSSLSVGQSTTLNPMPFETPIPYVQCNYFMDSPIVPGPGVQPQTTYTTETAGTSVTFTVVPVPEPSSAIAAGLIGLGVLTRRRSR